MSHKQFTGRNLVIRALLCEDSDIEYADGSMENEDVYLWFVSSTEQSYWFAFGISRECSQEQADRMISADIDVPEVIRMVYYLGLAWEHIEHDPHRIADQQRDAYQDMTLRNYKAVMKRSIPEIRELREQGEFEAEQEEPVGYVSRAVIYANRIALKDFLSGNLPTV